jgi:RNA exonuclease 1
MFTSKGLFSEVACPSRDRCLVPRCIFNHPDELAQAVPPAAKTERHGLTQNGDEPRKRRKFDSEEEAPSSSKEQIQLVRRETMRLPSSPSSSEAIPGERARRTFSIQRDISPPLRKKTNKDNNPAHNPTSTPHSEISNPPNSKSSSVPLTSKVSKKDLPSQRRPTPKKEALNPRALKGPTPASHDIRFRLLRALHEQFKRLNSELAKDASDQEEKLVLSDQELITRALDLEEDATKTLSIYSNVVKNKILLYKKMSVPKWMEERTREILKVEASRDNSTNQTSPKVIETGLTSEEELAFIPQLYAPTTLLAKADYVTKVPTDAEIKSAKEGLEAGRGFEVCDRCKTRFQIFPDRREEDGALASGGTCTYHYGRVFAERSSTNPRAQGEKRYRCCGQAIGDTSGCTQADSHVFKVGAAKRLASVLNFEVTPENPKKLSGKPVCIDGEMGYTINGMELIRLTATSWPDGEALFDVLVRPMGSVLDLNSRYSGVQPKDIADALPWDAHVAKDEASTSDANPKLHIVESPAAARSLLFSYLTPETPLIGHGLENDLNATRIIHPTIIDTALLFPHPRGLPLRNGLKMLMKKHLNRDIQVVLDGIMEGHDSKEDANAAGDLVRFKLGVEWKKAKLNGWKLENGECVPPPDREAHNAYFEVLGSSETAGRKRSIGETVAVEGS